MAIERAADHRALAADVWRRVFNLFVSTRGQRDHAMQRFKLSPNDAKTLSLMDASQGKPMRAVADACSTDASNATWVVDRLERLGLVERQTVAGDRRVKLVALTARGVKARDAIIEAMHEPPLELLALDRADLVALSKLLAKIPVPDVVPEPTKVETSRPPERRGRSRRLAQRR